MAMAKTSHLLLACLAVATGLFSSCKTKVDPNPDPPAGSLVFGDEGNESGNAIVVLADGNLLLLGGIQDPSTHDWDILLIKTDVNGNEIARTTIGEPDRNEIIRSAKASVHGGYLLAGHAKSNDNNAYLGQLFVIDADFQVQKSHTFLLHNDNNGYSGYSAQMIEYAEAFDMPDQGWMFTSQQAGYSNVVRLGPDGALQSNSFYTNQLVYSAPNFAPRYYFQDSTWAVYKFEVISQYSTNPQYQITRYRTDGIPDYSANYPLTSFQDSYSSIHVGGVTLLDNGHLLCTYHYPGGNQYLMEATLDGTTLWAHEINTNAAYYLVTKGADQRLYLAGSPSSTYNNVTLDKNVTIANFDAAGEDFQYRTFNGPKPDWPNGIAYLPNGRIATLGTTQSYGAGGADMFLTFD
jgi:hypothetical protein